MKLDGLKYGKEDGSREERFVERKDSKKISSASKSAPLPYVELPSDYTKPEGELDTRILFILSGGTDREKNYFKMLKDDHNLERIKVAFASKKGQGLNPSQLLEVANKSVDSKKFVAEDASYRFENKNGDIIYLLQDIDEFEAEIRGLAKDRQPECLRWIVSNPAFEMWLYYHYYDNPLPKLKEATEKTTAERSRWLKGYLPSIIKGGVRTTKAIAQMRTAIENSKSNYKEEEGLPSLFSTQMHLLAEDILDTMGEEFDQMLERKAAFNKAMREKFRKPIVKSIRYDGEKIKRLISDFSEWADSHPLWLPRIMDVGDEGSHYFDNRAFPVSYKLEKAYLDDDSGKSMPINTDELFMENIQNEIYHFYQILFIQNNPIASYTIDFSEIKDVIDLLGLDNQYAILSSFHLSTFDSLYGGDPLQETDRGYLYKDVELYKTPAHGRFMIIMRKEYLPKADFKRYEGDNTEFELIDEKNFIYSNIHRMKDLGDSYGLAVMRVVKFQMPPKESFRFIKLDIVDYQKDKSEIGKMGKGDIIGLEYEYGDLVRIKDDYRNRYSSLYKHDSMFSVSKVNKDGTVILDTIERPVCFEHIEPIPINGSDDRDIYYDPFIAASFIGSDGLKSALTTDYSYYLEHFKRNTFEGEEETLYDKCMKQKFRYVHEVQHWLRDIYGWDRLFVKYKI